MQRHSRWQPCCLAETLLQAPALLAAIPTQDWSALLACSRQLRHLICSPVQAITITTGSDIQPIAQHSWPQLCLILAPAARDIYRYRDSLPTNCIITTLTATSAENPTGMATAVIVRPQEWYCQPTWYIAAAFVVLRRLWSQRAIALAIYVNCKAEEVLKHLNQGEWPCVHHLCLLSSNLTAAALWHMLKPVWPKLEHLGLNSTKVDGVALHAFNNRGWDVLNSVDLSNNPLDAFAIQMIPQMFRQCSRLCLSDMQLNDASADSLMTMRAHLVDLELSYSAIGPTKIRRLFLLPWPKLKYLDLSHNALAGDGMASLIYVDLPSLSHLDVSSNKLDVIATGLLASGKWPRLRQLSLDDNQLGDAAMIALQHNTWLLMQTFSVSGNQISIQGIRTLTQCCWPVLRNVILDNSVASDATATLSDLKVHLHFRS